MKLDQQIYKALLKNAGGVQRKIIGLEHPTLNKMKRGEGTTTFSKLFQVLLDNGIEHIELFTKNTKMDIYAKDKEIKVKTTKL